MQVLEVVAIREPDGVLRYMSKHFGCCSSFRPNGQADTPEGLKLVSECGRWHHYICQPTDCEDRPVGPPRWWWHCPENDRWFFQPRESIKVGRAFVCSGHGQPVKRAMTWNDEEQVAFKIIKNDWNEDEVIPVAFSDLE